MAELQTLARPYAKAVFDLAREGGSLADWGTRLSAIATAVQTPEIAAMIGHPRVTRQALAATLNEALASVVGAEGQGFIRLLAENGRLKAAPLIAEQFEAMRAEAESRVDVQITSASQVPWDQQSQLQSAIGQRLHRQVDIQWSIDESLIAGAVIRAGDLVIDGSVSGELARLQNSLSR